MRRIIALSIVLFFCFALEAQTLTGQGYILSKSKNGQVQSTTNNSIPQEELEQIRLTITRLDSLMNLYAQQVVENGDFMQTENEITSLFNAYGEQRDTRIYNMIPLIKNNNDDFLFTTSPHTNFAQYYKKALDTNRSFTDNIQNVLQSIENLIYIDNYKELFFTSANATMFLKSRATRIPEGYYGDKLIPEHIIIPCGYAIESIDGNNNKKRCVIPIVFSFRNGKIESIVPPENTLAYNRAFKLYMENNYRDSFRLLKYLAGCKHMFSMVKVHESILYTLLAECWQSGQIDSPYPQKVKKIIAEQYFQLVKFLNFRNELAITKNPDLADSIMRYRTAYFSLYGHTEPFSQGLMPAWDAKQKKYGYINCEGDFRIRPQFSTATRFNYGIAVTEVNFMGMPLITIQHWEWPTENTDILGYIKAQYNNTYSVFSLTTKKFGCLNRKGEVCVPFIYDDAVEFLFDNQYATCKRDGKYGVVSIDGKEVVPCKYNNYIGDVVQNNGMLYYLIGDEIYSIKL